MIVHAGLIARRIGGPWRGVLIEGLSGGGKSDLALRALDHGFVLVADDRVRLFTSEGRLFGRAPEPLAGLIEARGVGILRRPFLPFAAVTLVVRCVAEPAAVERLPEPGRAEHLGVTLPAIDIWPFEPGAPGKLAAALERLGAGARQGYEARFAPPSGREGA
ncbi:MAG TPA: HPr kinase/phosphorylase [Caulobacteraceae bacterium]|nr:HPr kinase/phosphorylase [Caulobacteraceae bacterium]